MKLVIWGPSVPEADAVGRRLGLSRRQYVAVSTRNPDALRGVTASGILILPGSLDARDRRVAAQLTVLRMARSIPVIDLRTLIVPTDS